MKKIFLFFILISACSPLKKYQKEAIFWEPDIEALERKDKSQTDPANPILFIGSSSIRLWDNIETDMAPYKTIQRGYGGAKFSDLLVYAKRIVYPHQFKAVAVFVANDITGSENDKSPRQVLKMYQYLVKIIRKKNSAANIYFIGITPTPSRWSVWDKISQANNLIENYCETQKNLFFIKTDFAYLDNDQKPIDSLFREDKLHMKQSGYNIWAKLIKDKLDKTLK